MADQLIFKSPSEDKNWFRWSIHFYMQNPAFDYLNWCEKCDCWHIEAEHIKADAK